MKENVTLICEACGESFERYKALHESNVRRGRTGVFCSRSCFADGAKRLETKACLNCGEDVIRRPSEFGENVFCSSSCAASYNNLGVSRVGRSKEMVCPECGGKKSSRAVMCRSCRTASGRSATIGEILDKYSGSGIYAQRRAFDKIRDCARRSNSAKECSCCGWKHGIVLHHVIPLNELHLDTTIAEANSSENLLHLCGNCHAYIHEFGKLPEYKTYAALV